MTQEKRRSKILRAVADASDVCGPPKTVDDQLAGIQALAFVLASHHCAAERLPKNQIQPCGNFILQKLDEFTNQNREASN